MKVSILMLTHNAPKYVRESIETVKNRTKGVDYELIVVDNASGFRTRNLLKKLDRKGFIDRLYLNPENSLFAKGNNIASTLVSDDADMYLLLNSDIKVNSDDWLEKLISIHPEGGGVSSYGVVDTEPVRADGYCFLINRSLYDRYRLDEDFAWFWGITKLESLILKEGKAIVSVRDHENKLHHYGGKSGKGFKHAAGMGIDIEEVKKWFTTGRVEIIDHID